MRVFRQDEAKRVRGGLFRITLRQLASRILTLMGHWHSICLKILFL